MVLWFHRKQSLNGANSVANPDTVVQATQSADLEPEPVPEPEPNLNQPPETPIEPELELEQGKTTQGKPFEEQQAEAEAASQAVGDLRASRAKRSHV